MGSFKSFQDTLSNEKGMSLPSVMMVAVTGVLIAGALTGLLLSSGKSTQRRTDSTAFETFHENLKNVVENPKGCTEMLKGKKVNLAIGGETRLKLDHDFDGNADLGKGFEDQNKEFKIGQAVLYNLGGVVRTPREHDKPEVNFTYPMRLLLRPKNMLVSVDRKLNRKNKLEEKLIKMDHMQFEDFNETPLKKTNIDARIFVTVNSKAEVIKCYGYKSDASSCESAGGTYDLAEKNAALSCKPDFRCMASKRGIVKAPNRCNPPFDQTITDLGGMGVPKYDPATDKTVTVPDPKFLCQWCHPFPHPGRSQTYVSPTGEVIGGNEEWLEQKWRGIETSANSAYAAGLKPDDLTSKVPKTFPEITLMDLAAEWDYMLSVTYQSDVTLSDDDATKAIQDAVDNLEDANLAVKAKKDEINNLDWVIEDLKDDVSSLQRQAASGKTNEEMVREAQRRMNAAQSALDADPTNATLQQEYADAAEDLDDAIYVRDNNITVADKKRDLAKAEKELTQASTDLKGLEDKQGAAQAVVDEYTNGGELDVNELLDPTELVKDWLVATYGFDPKVIEYMDQVRGCIGYVGAGKCY